MVPAHAAGTGADAALPIPVADPGLLSAQRMLKRFVRMEIACRLLNVALDVMLHRKMIAKAISNEGGSSGGSSGSSSAEPIQRLVNAIKAKADAVAPGNADGFGAPQDRFVVALLSTSETILKDLDKSRA